MRYVQNIWRLKDKWRASNISKKRNETDFYNTTYKVGKEYTSKKYNHI